MPPSLIFSEKFYARRYYRRNRALTCETVYRVLAAKSGEAVPAVKQPSTPNRARRAAPSLAPSLTHSAPLAPLRSLAPSLACAPSLIFAFLYNK